MWSVIGSTYLCNTRSEDDGKTSEIKRMQNPPCRCPACRPCRDILCAGASKVVYGDTSRWPEPEARARARHHARGSTHQSPLRRRPHLDRAAQHATERKQHPSRSQISVWAASGLHLGMGIGPVPIQTHDEIKFIINCFRIRARFLERTTGA